MIEIKCLENMDVALSVIRSAPYTRNVQIDDHHITVELEAADDEVAADTQAPAEAADAPEEGADEEKK